MLSKTKTKPQSIIPGLVITLLLSGLAFAVARRDSHRNRVTEQPIQLDNPQPRNQDVAPSTPSGGQFDLVRTLIAGGGGKSAGGNIELIGSIGQATAGLMSGGQFSLTSGFWQPESSTSTPTPTPTPTPNPNPTPTPGPGSSSVQFSASNYSVNESSDFTTIVVTRAGDTSTPATVKYSTNDLTDVNFRCNPATQGQITGAASRKCDYHISVGRLRFAAGETSKQIILSVVRDVYVEGPEALTITLSSPTGATLGNTSIATVTIFDDDTPGQANPVEGTSFYVRMLYVDLLSREPEPGGFAGWTHRIDYCGQQGEPPPPCDRVTVGGDGFLQSDEFFDRQFFVIRLYRTGLGRIPAYDDVGDLAYVSGFLSPDDLELNKQELVDEIMSRPEFSSAYNSFDNAGFVDKLIQTAAVTVPQNVRDSWVNALNSGTTTRALVFRQLSERPEVSAKYLHEAQVASCYYGFFTRNPDAAYFNYLARLDSGEITLADLAFAFINADEYRSRFGQ